MRLSACVRLVYSHDMHCMYLWFDNHATSYIYASRKASNHKRLYSCNMHLKAAKHTFQHDTDMHSMD